MVKKKFEVLYAVPGKTPWTFTKTPREIQRLVRKKIITPKMSVLEIGCGEGYQSIFLTKKGMKVTAIDFSKNAIKLAKENAKRSGANISFKELSYLDLKKMDKSFDFIFDWRFLHEITDEVHRKTYLRVISKLLKKDGLYLTVSFSGDSNFMGKGKLRKSPIGISLYFAPLKELEKRIQERFSIVESMHILVPERPNQLVLANYILSKSRRKYVV